MKKGYLLDMDGVIYRGGEVILGAVEFVRRLRETDTPFLFLTNNSQRTRRDVATKLCRMGIDATEDDVFTCAMATARFLARQKPGGTAYVIGEGGLLNALHHNGYSVVEDSPDYVVIGEGRAFTFEMIEKATGKQAFSLGKPSPLMMLEARKQLGLSTAQTVMVGDTMETDILGGVQLGFRTVLVLSGGTKISDLANFAYQPDMIVNDCGEIELDQVFHRELLECKIA